jgi:hypothetical protein
MEDSMSDSNFRQPHLGQLRVRAETAEPVQAASGLVIVYACPLSNSDPLAPCTGTRQITYAALGILDAFRYAVALFGSRSAWLITGRLYPDPGTGR